MSNHLLEKQLYDFMVKQGTNASDAALAARRCARVVSKGFFIGGSAGFACGVKTFNPATLILAAIGGAFGGGFLALGASDSCKEVRDAATKLANFERLGKL